MIPERQCRKDGLLKIGEDALQGLAILRSGGRKLSGRRPRLRWRQNRQFAHAIEVIKNPLDVTIGGGSKFTSPFVQKGRRGPIQLLFH